MPRKEALARMTPAQRDREREISRNWNRENAEYCAEQFYLRRQRRLASDPEALAAETAARLAREARLKIADPERYRAKLRAKQKAIRLKHPEIFRQKSRKRYLIKHPLTQEKQRALVDRIKNFLPHNLAGQMREELLGKIVAEFYEGRLSRTFTKDELRIYINEFYRENSQFTKTDSLDEVLRGGVSRGQILGIF